MNILGKKDSTQAALRQSVFRAARLLEERWDDPPSAAEMARAAGLSLFHFHRAFQAVVGEPVARHSLRLRVERAASLLKFSSWQAQEIALACGFATQSNFARAFKQFYGLTPGEYRAAEELVPFLRGPMRSRASAGKPRAALPEPTVSLEDWPELTVVSLRYYGGLSGLHEPWREMLRWARANLESPQDARYFGLWFDEWSASQTLRTAWRYECAVLAPGVAPPPPFHARVIPAGRVAVARARGTVMALDRAWRCFATGWLPFSGFQPRLEFALDEYPAGLMLSSPLSKISAGLLGFPLKMCLPVQSGAMAL